MRASHKLGRSGRGGGCRTHPPCAPILFGGFILGRTCLGRHCAERGHKDGRKGDEKAMNHGSRTRVRPRAAAATELGKSASTLIPVPGTAGLRIPRHARSSWLRSSNLSRNDNMGRFRTTPDVNPGVASESNRGGAIRAASCTKGPARHSDLSSAVWGRGPACCIT